MDKLVDMHKMSSPQLIRCFRVFFFRGIRNSYRIHRTKRLCVNLAILTVRRGVVADDNNQSASVIMI